MNVFCLKFQFGKGFVLLYLLHHPEMQKKMQEELDSVCGDALPTFDQRPM